MSDKPRVMDSPGLARRPLDGALDRIATQRAQMDAAVKKLIRIQGLTPTVGRPIDEVIRLLDARTPEQVAAVLPQKSARVKP